MQFNSPDTGVPGPWLGGLRCSPLSALVLFFPILLRVRSTLRRAFLGDIVCVPLLLARLLSLLLAASFATLGGVILFLVWIVSH